MKKTVSTKTKPEIFIVESLSLDDENRGRQEGDIISRLLHIAGKTKTKYYYIRTRQELEKILDIFGKSNYRYLHISCHADSKSMYTTLDKVSYTDLGKMLRPYLNKRRIFVSACKMANYRLAKELFYDTNCYSLIGPEIDIKYADAATFWISFYHLMFKKNEAKMSRENMKECVKNLSKLYNVKISYFAASKMQEKNFVRVKM